MENHHSRNIVHISNTQQALMRGELRATQARTPLHMLLQRTRCMEAEVAKHRAVFSQMGMHEIDEKLLLAHSLYDIATDARADIGGKAMGSQGRLKRLRARTKTLAGVRRGALRLCKARGIDAHDFAIRVSDWRISVVLDNAQLLRARLEKNADVLGGALTPWIQKVECVIALLEEDLVSDASQTPQKIRTLAHGALENVVKEIRNFGLSALQDHPESAAALATPKARSSSSSSRTSVIDVASDEKTVVTMALSNTEEEARDIDAFAGQAIAA